MPLILTDSCMRVTASECLAVGVCLQLSKKFACFLGLKPCLWYRRERSDVIKKKRVTIGANLFVLFPNVLRRVWDKSRRPIVRWNYPQIAEYKQNLPRLNSTWGSFDVRIAPAKDHKEREREGSISRGNKQTQNHTQVWLVRGLGRVLKHVPTLRAHSTVN